MNQFLIDPPTPSKRILPIHTSDRGLYKTCRRRWLWGSHLNRGYEPVSKAAPLWFGETIHYALKEFHGHHRLPTIHDAFMEYVELCVAEYPKLLPPETPELIKLGLGMLDHYMMWLQRRDPLTTYVFNGVPQVEVAFEIELPVEQSLLDLIGVEKVVYRGTFDRISIDEYGHLWIVEYKTAARIETGHLLVDPQVTAYCFAAQCIYDLPVVGVIYQQHRKDLPKPPRILKNGGVSEDKNQQTTHAMYREALMRVYGNKAHWSAKHYDVLNNLALKENMDKDNYIVRTRVHRNIQSLVNEQQKIMLEVNEMIDPGTPMYPHAGRHCPLCPFMSPCVSLDDGSDYLTELNDPDVYKKRTRASSEWEILSFDKLGGVLYSANAEVIHDRAGRPEFNVSTRSSTHPKAGGAASDFDTVATGIELGSDAPYEACDFGAGEASS
jgi:hypothetical protein